MICRIICTVFNVIITSVKEVFMFSPLSVWLLARYLKKLWTNFDETFRDDCSRAKDQSIRFWGRSRCFLWIQDHFEGFFTIARWGKIEDCSAWRRYALYRVPSTSSYFIHTQLLTDIQFTLLFREEFMPKFSCFQKLRSTTVKSA
jgi:hypothetical protein